MARPPAQLTGDGRVLLEPGAAAWLLVAVEGSLRAHRRNGSALPPGPRAVVAALASAAPETAIHLHAVLAEVKALGVTAVDPQASQPAGSVETATGEVLLPVRRRPSSDARPLSTPEVARMTGLTTHAVRAAIRRGRLDATLAADGQYRTTMRAVEKWRGCAA